MILHLPKTIVHIHLALELIKYCCLEKNKGRQEKEEEEKEEKQNSALS